MNIVQWGASRYHALSGSGRYTGCGKKVPPGAKTESLVFKASIPGWPASACGRCFDV